MTTTTVSIALATYEMRGVGARFILQNLSLIALQSYEHIEVIVSDHSLNDDIRNICQSFQGKLDVRYFRNTVNRGCSSCNFNNAFSKCSGDLIKVLMQDDMLYDHAAIEKIVKAFESPTVTWLVSGCCYGSNFDAPTGSMVPSYHDSDIIRGVNTIGSPSVLVLRKECLLRFDEQLIWMMDCDYYKRLFDKFGHPAVLEESLVFITHHKDQISAWLDGTTRQNEEQLVRERYTQLTIQELYQVACNTPSDINEHLPRLMVMASLCDQVVELGVRSGVSTTALLAGLDQRRKCGVRGPRQLHSFDVNDCSNAIPSAALDGVGGDVEWHFRQGNSLNVDIPPCELLLIDTRHTADQLAGELNRHHRCVSRWIVLHDTKTFGVRGEDGGEGLLPGLERFQQQFPEWQTIIVQHNNNGLTVLEREPL